MKDSVRKRRRLWGRLLLAVFSALVLGALSIYADVHENNVPIYEDVARVPPMPVAVVFGASDLVMQDRVRTAVDLYKAGKVQRLLLTGDIYPNGYNEAQQMRRLALAGGVPDRALLYDASSLRTYDSVYRARTVFGVTRAVFVTQRYHLPRALYLGRSLGLQVVGLDATRHRYSDPVKRELREIGATEAAWFDIHFHRRPTDRTR